MKNIMKISALVLSFVMLIATVNLTAYALDESGNCGENNTYTFDVESGELNINGTGTVADSAFSNCNEITKAYLYCGVTGIGANTFENDANIEEVIIPATVTSIGSYAFSGCTGLTTVYYTGTEEQWAQIEFTTKDGVDGNDCLKNADIYCERFCRHNYDEVVTPATCKAGGYTTYTCPICGDSYKTGYTDIIYHIAGDAVKEDGLAPTVSEGGYYFLATYCTMCGTELSRECVDVPATGVNITIGRYDIGAVTVNGEAADGSKESSFNAAYNSEVTLVLTQGTEYFKGWKKGDEIVSTETTYKVTATADMTFTPVFDVPVTERYTVKVVDENGTDITDSVLTLPANVTKDAVPYDTKITAASENASGWAIDGVTVGAGNSFTFYVGSNTTITMLSSETQSVPSTTIIGAAKLDAPAYRYNIVATRFVPEGYTLVDFGFIYGRNLTDDDLVLENEGQDGTGQNSGKVKVVRAGNVDTISNESAIKYGVRSQGNSVCVRAFIIVTKGDAEQTIYSNIERYNS